LKPSFKSIKMEVWQKGVKKVDPPLPPPPPPKMGGFAIDPNRTVITISKIPGGQRMSAWTGQQFLQIKNIDPSANDRMRTQELNRNLDPSLR
jgi:hypothetical protein